MAWLAQSQVAHYLLALGLVKPRAVLDGDLVVTDASRRNAVFVVTGAESTFVVKQGEPTVAREAAVLRALARDPALAALVPEPVHYDPAAVRLVLRSPPGGRDFHLHYAGRRAPRSAARALGQGLAAVHAARPALDQPAVDRLWGLSLPEPPSAQLHELSAGALDLLARLQAGDALCERLRRLRAAPAQDGFVHGDLRWDNCLALGGRKTRVLLIDWELAGHGDPAADVGAALAEPLRLWVGSLPLSDPADPLRLRAHARHPLTALRPSIGAFWAGYQNAAVRPVAAERAVELAAARLVQAAVEHAQGLARASAHVLALLQLADNLLADPADAAHGLLGLTG